MKRLIFILIMLMLILDITLFASESRIIGLGILSTAQVIVEDPFNMVFEPRYVNSSYNFVDFEPIIASSDFYALVKYSISTTIEKFNLGVIINYPYQELSYIPLIATGVPAGFLTPNTTPLQNFTLTDNSKDRIDLLVGLDKILAINFLKPYIGVGYSADFSVTTSSNETNGTKTINEQSISQVKILLGSTVELGFVEISPTVKIFLPSALNYTSNFSTNVQSYQDFRHHSLLSTFNFSFQVPAKLKLDGDKTYIKIFGTYFNYYLPSVQTRKLDQNGDGDFADPTEENTEITNNYGVSSYGILASYNTYILNNILILIGTGYHLIASDRKIVALGTANGTAETNDNQYVAQSSDSTIPIFLSTEIPFTDWLTFRTGVAGNILQTSYSYTKNGKDGQATINISTSSSLISSFMIGFSIKPIKGLSLDWVLSNSFINDAFINGRLPWIISGNNFFDNVSQKFSIEWIF